MNQPLFNNKNDCVLRSLRMVVYLVIIALTMGVWPITANPNKELIQKLPALPNPRHQEILYKLLIAEIAATRDMRSIALNYYLQAAELTQDPRIAEQATLLAINFQSPSAAVSSAKLWANIDPKNLQAQLVAITLLIGHSTEEALPFLKQALKIEPAEASQYLVEIQARLHDTSANNLKTALTLLATQEPNNPYSHLAAAESAAEQGDIKNANYWVDSTLKLTPSLTRALELKTRLIRYEAKTYIPAISFLTTQLEKFPENAELRFFYTTMLLESDKLEEAKKELIKLTNDKLLQGQALLRLGEIYFKENNLNNASDTLQKALMFPESKEAAQYLLGEIAEQESKIPTAIQQYSLIESGPYHIPAVLRAVFLLKKTRAYKEAIYLLHNSTPTSVEEQKQLLLTEIDLLNTSKQSEEAMQLANEILPKLPNDTDVLFMHAVTAVKLKSWEIAEDDLKKILKQNPNNASALNSLGYVLSFNKDRLPEALNYLVQALALAPNNPAFMDSLGWIYYRTGDLQLALSYLKKANHLSDDGEIAAHLGEVLWMSNYKNEALIVWKKALEKHNDSEELLDTLKRLSIDIDSTYQP